MEVNISGPRNERDPKPGNAAATSGSALRLRLDDIDRGHPADRRGGRQASRRGQSYAQRAGASLNARASRHAASSSFSPARWAGDAADVCGVVTGRAGRGAPPLDHAESQSAGHFEPAHEIVGWRFGEESPQKIRAQGGAPPPHPPPRPQRTWRRHSDVRKSHGLISLLILWKFHLPGRARWGWGVASPRPRVFWGDFRAQNHHLVARLEGPRDCTQRGRGRRPPAPPGNFGTASDSRSAGNAAASTRS